jgi:hypothetical protein
MSNEQPIEQSMDMRAITEIAKWCDTVDQFADFLVQRGDGDLARELSTKIDFALMDLDFSTQPDLFDGVESKDEHI